MTFDTSVNLTLNKVVILNTGAAGITMTSQNAANLYNVAITNPTTDGIATFGSFYTSILDNVRVVSDNFVMISGLSLDFMSGSVVRNCYVSGANGSGIYTNNGSSNTFESCVAVNTHSTTLLGVGIYLDSATTANVLQNCVVQFIESTLAGAVGYYSVAGGNLFINCSATNIGVGSGSTTNAIGFADDQFRNCTVAAITADNLGSFAAGFYLNGFASGCFDCLATNIYNLAPVIGGAGFGFHAIGDDATVNNCVATNILGIGFEGSADSVFFNDCQANDTGLGFLCSQSNFITIARCSAVNCAGGFDAGGVGNTNPLVLNFATGNLVNYVNAPNVFDSLAVQGCGSNFTYP